MRLPWFLSLVSFLAACASATVERDMEDVFRIYGPACEKLGYEKETEKWKKCALHLDACAGHCTTRRQNWNR
jgi:hypothetical protein